MKLRLLLIAGGLLMSTPHVLAQETPNPGDACAVGEEGIHVKIGGPEEPDGQWLVCNGSAYVPLIEYQSTGRSLINIGNDSGSCTSAKIGRLRYDEGGDTWEYCDGSTWLPFESAASGGAEFSGPPDCPDIGDQCPDNTIYAGYHPTLTDGNGEWLFLHPNNQSAGAAWSNVSVATGANDSAAGEVNQSWIVANTTITDYPAFKLCDDLNLASELGHADWYLPSRIELFYLWSVQSAINAGPGDNFIATNYWSSTEPNSSVTAWYVFFSNGTLQNAGKTFAQDVRCLRREPAAASAGGCTAPASCPNVGDVCSGDGSGGGNPKFAGCITYYDANSADVGLTKAIYVTQANQSTASVWKNASGTNDISTDSTEDGKINSANRGGLLSNFPAFELCENLTDGGYTDWYLPARTELDLLWRNAATITGFTTSTYWSSTEYTTGSAWYQGFSAGDQSFFTKTTNFDVRCVRRD